MIIFLTEYFFKEKELDNFNSSFPLWFILPV